MNAPRHWRTPTLQDNYCSTLSPLFSQMQLPEQTAVNQRIATFDWHFFVRARPKATLVELLYLMLSPSFCFSFSMPCKHWWNNAFHYTEERRWVSLVAPLHLNNRSTAVFKKLITFLAVGKVSRYTLSCNIGSSDQRQISAETRKSCLWWVQHVNDLCVFIGHGAGPASLQDSGVGTTLWQRLATATVGRADPATALHSFPSLSAGCFVCPRTIYLWFTLSFCLVFFFSLYFYCVSRSYFSCIWHVSLLKGQKVWLNDFTQVVSYPQDSQI